MDDIDTIYLAAKKINPSITKTALFEDIDTMSIDHPLAAAILDILNTEYLCGFFEEGHYEKTSEKKEILSYKKSLLTAKIISKVFPKRISLKYSDSVLNCTKEKQVIEAAKNVNKNGYHILTETLSEDKISEFVLSLDELSFNNRKNNQSLSGKDLRLYQKYHSGSWWIDRMDKLASLDIAQTFAFDPVFLGIAQEALGVEPIHVQTNVWWSFPTIQKWMTRHQMQNRRMRKDRSQNAQLFHQDQEFVTFVKIFIYLKDVGPNNGPHVYVCQSANNYEENLPGYITSRRIPDEKIKKAFGADNIIPITGPAGQVSIVNTRGFHKGAPVVEGSRFILQLEYASSLYSTSIEPFSSFYLNTDSMNLKSKHPRVFMNYRECELKDLATEKVMSFKKPDITTRKRPNVIKRFVEYWI